MSCSDTDGVEEEKGEEDGTRERGRSGADSLNAQDSEGKKAKTRAAISSAAVAASCSCRDLLGMLGGFALGWCHGRGSGELSLHANGSMTWRGRSWQGCDAF